jgi:hypothetical protein
VQISERGGGLLWGVVSNVQNLEYRLDTGLLNSILGVGLTIVRGEVGFKTV